MILYLKDPKTPSKKLLHIINTFNKVARYKVNLQKLVIFQNTNNEQIEKEYRKTVSCNNLKKYLGINLINDENDLYNENYKSLRREIEQDYRRWKDLPGS
jgi:hypothetical protein